MVNVDFMKNVLPPLKLPSRLSKFRKWSSDTFANLSEQLNEHLPARLRPRREAAPRDPPTMATAANTTTPMGISAISSDVPIQFSSNAQSENYGLYALKCDRSAAKKGILLKLNPHRAMASRTAEASVKTIHEKFLPSQVDWHDVNECEEEMLQIEAEEDDAKRSQISNKNNPTIVPPPRRKKRISQRNKQEIKSFPSDLAADSSTNRPLINSNLAKNKSEPFRMGPGNKKAERENFRKSEGTWIVEQKPKEIRTKSSVNIFQRESPMDVFKEFDEIFKEEEKRLKNLPFSTSTESEDSIADKTFSKKKFGSISTSSSQSLDNLPSLLRPPPPAIKVLPVRRNSNVTVQHFKAKDLPRCLSIVSPNVSPSPPPSFQMIGDNKQIAKVPLKAKQTAPSPLTPHINRKSFVYYNDEDELVLDKNRKKLANGSHLSEKPPSASGGALPFSPFQLNVVDNLYQQYYGGENSLTRSTSSEGIFI